MLCWRSQRIRSPCWLGAAALSAAVTSTKPQETAPNSQAEPSRQKHLTASANRFPGGSAREGPFSERPPPSQYLLRIPPAAVGAAGVGGGNGALVA